MEPLNILTLIITKLKKTYLYFVKLNCIPQEPCFRKHELKSEKDRWEGCVEGNKQIVTG